MRNIEISMLQVRENEITAQTVWWFCAAAHLRGNIGPYITSSDCGERGFQNDWWGKKYIQHLKFWWRNVNAP